MKNTFHEIALTLVEKLRKVGAEVTFVTDEIKAPYHKMIEKHLKTTALA